MRGVCFILATMGVGALGLDCPRSNCPPEIRSVPSVAGTYRYFSDNPFEITGTITLEQEGNIVRIINTTYDNNDRNRPLIGEGIIVGNVLDVDLVPENGDTNYKADVLFIFSRDGNEFCVQYSDTNGDSGPLGSFRAVRQ